MSLILLFMLPGVSALFLYNHPGYIHSTTNRGALVQTSMKMIPLDEKQQWKLVYWNKQSCRQNCLKILDKLYRVRLALGRRYYKVSEWLLQDDNVTSPSGKQLKIMKKHNIHFTSLTQREVKLREVLKSKSAIFIISPQRDFVLTYPLNVSPDDIFKDLKHLLTVSEKHTG